MSFSSARAKFLAISPGGDGCLIPDRTVWTALTRSDIFLGHGSFLRVLEEEVGASSRWLLPKVEEEDKVRASSAERPPRNRLLRVVEFDV